MKKERNIDEMIKAALPTETPSARFVDNVMTQIEAESKVVAKTPRFTTPEVIGIGVVVVLACLALLMAADQASPYEALNNLLHSATLKAFNSPLYAIGLFILSGLLLLDKFFGKLRLTLV
ncbi:MAG: hypothetical protein HQ500_05460 [Flavobacteriales bacterium]|nr:hypothetical protein [Flavobacteriales bacterium]